MKMSSLWWTSLAVFVAIFAQAVKCESTAFPVIPSYLQECYMDDGIYHRANRLSSTLESFVDLLQKLESSPTSRNMNARELSLALLNYLKLDGIISIRSQTKYLPSHILPFAPSGAEYFKHRVTLVGLVPKIDESYMTVFNETLTKTELCNLHFLLSYSIDPYKRDDERCSPLFEETRRATDARPRSNFPSYHYGSGYHHRYRRHVDHEDIINEVNTGKNGKPLKSEEEWSNGIKKHSKAFQKRSSQDEKNRKSEVEEIPVDGKQGRILREEKDKFTIGDQELLSAAEGHNGAGLQSLVQVGTFGQYGGRPYSTGYSTDESSYSGIMPGIPLSDCPVVNGVIKTPYGSLTIGTIVAGIAAGLNPQEIPPMKLSVSMSELNSPSDKVKNIWATTLAGTIADTISSSALLNMNNLQILKGGWNESVEQKWYLLSSSQFQQMTEVGVRGGLDGLLLGLGVKEWTGKFPNFKLSQIIQTYYENLWGTLGAKYRVQIRPQYVSDEELRKQVHLMSLVLKKQKTNVLTVLNYDNIVREVVGKVIQHLQTMDDIDKSYIGSLLPTRIDSFVNTIAVVDSSWGYDNLYKIFQELRYSRVVNAEGSKLTVLCGNDGRVITTSQNSADFHNQFTKDMLLENCTRGMNYPLVFDALDVLYRKLFNDEKLSKKINTASQVALLLPFDSFLQDDVEYLKVKSRDIRKNFPGVRLIIASNGNSEALLPLVESSKDLFPLVPFTSDQSLKTVKNLAEGIKQSYQRISRPSCGSYFNDDTAGEETRFTSDLIPGNVVYYRLLPQYFYTQKERATITIKSKQGAPLTVCHSRDNDRPTGPTPREIVPNYDHGGNPSYRPDFPPEASLYGKQTDVEGAVECKTIKTEVYRIDLDNPCDGASNLGECRPLYISLTAPLQETVSIICQNCRLPVCVQYEISVTGLTCYNSAAALLATPLLLSLLLIHYFF